MNKTFIQTIEKYKLLQNGDKVIVALSGGADSVTLLDMLNSVKEIYNLTIYASHINHGLRGEEADRDENFCKILCKIYNTELFVKKADIKILAKEQKISEELCGRNVRYSYFEELSQNLSAKIATAHTASDNIETLLFNITRGSSVTGAGAITPKRGNIIRPLIMLTREDIEQYCEQNNLEYVTDSTNLTDDYTRNKIRHQVIPVLKQINPQLELSAFHFSESARETAEYINIQTDKAIENAKCEYGYNCKSLLNNSNAILKNTVSLICKKHSGITPEYKHIELILEVLHNNGAVSIGNGYNAVSKQGILRIIGNVENENCNPILLKGDTTFNNYIIKIDNSLSENKITLRTRNNTDKFTYFKRNITKPLRKVMNEMKIPSELRDNLILIAEDETVLWCELIGYSKQGEHYKKSNQLLIEVKDA